MPSVQSLSICLSVALVVFTGVIVGSLSISTGDRLLADCRAGGDAAVGMSIDSSDKDIRQMAMRYLGRVTGSVEERIGAFFASGERVLKFAGELGRSVPPEYMTGRGAEGANFLNTTVRLHLLQAMRVGHEHGIDMALWRWGDGTGEMVFYRMGAPMAVPRRDGTPDWGIIQSESAPGVFGEGNGMLVASGQADGRGHMKNTDLPCWVFRANLTEMPLGDLDKIDWGRCVLPRQYFYFVPHITQAEYRMLRNAKLPESPATQLAPANEVVFSPMYAYFHWQTMQAHIAITHPDMPNDLGPRQGNRVGYFSISMSGEKVSDIFATTAVPAGSVLYCVERDPWSGEVGNLLATNHGRLTGWTQVQPPGARVAYPFRVPLQVWNHTVTENDTAVSVIGQHSTYVRGLGGFDAVANATRDEFIEWVGEDGTTYWFTVLHMQFANLNWYISLLVPRSSIMDRMDASVEAIRAANAATRREADADKERSLTITLVVTVVVAAVLMVASVLMTKMILSPIMVLGEDMASVATMRVESVDLESELSSLSEVHSMQESFRAMVRNLIEYKQYMPQAVLLDSSDEEEDDATTVASKSEVMTRRSSSMMTIDRVKSNGSAICHAPAAKANRLQDASLKRKQITVVCYNIVGWARVVGGLADTEFRTLCTSMTAAVQAGVTMHRGVTDVFSGDHFVVAHNAFTTQSTHKAGALRAALEVARAVKLIEVPRALDGSGKGGALRLSYGACSGEARVGQLGCAGMKKVTVHSSATAFAVGLEKYNKTRGLMGVADESVLRDVSTMFVWRTVDVVSSGKRAAGLWRNSARVTPSGGEEAAAADAGADAAARAGVSPLRRVVVLVAEVYGEQSAACDEWMYQMRDAEAANPYAGWNAAFAAGREGDWQSVTRMLQELEEGVVDGEERGRLRLMAVGREMIVVELE